MPLPSFHEWLEHRLEAVPDATTLALAIARSGAAGVSREETARALGVPGETGEPLLRATAASGQVTILQRNGQLVYRAAG